MERRNALELETWKEVARRADVQAVLDALAARLATELPGAALRVRAIDAARSSLETVGSTGAAPPSGRDHFEPAEWQRLVAWAARREIFSGAARDVRQRFGPVVGEAERCDCRLGALIEGEGLIGIVVLSSTARGGLGPSHSTRLQALLDPLPVGFGCGSLDGLEHDEAGQAGRAIGEGGALPTCVDGGPEPRIPWLAFA